MPMRYNLPPMNLRRQQYPSDMPISEERIEEFRQMYKQAYGEEVSVGDAQTMALRLITLYRLLMRPLPDEGPSLPSEESPVQSAPGVS